jgi:hypothetical protein
MNVEEAYPQEFCGFKSVTVSKAVIITGALFAIVGALIQTVANGNNAILYTGLVFGIFGTIFGFFGAWIPYMSTSSLKSGSDTCANCQLTKRGRDNPTNGAYCACPP